jgi:ubiquinone/menaquinone biosynthesis C-methylase UbiE
LLSFDQQTGKASHNISGMGIFPGVKCVASKQRLESLPLMPIKKLLRDPFKRFLFEVGADYYARKLATGPEADIRREFVAALALPPAALNSHLKFLDVGCGPGHVARMLAESGYNVTGVDRSHSLLRIARRLASKLASANRLAFHHSTTERLPFDAAAFDITYATGVIYWVEHLPETLREIVRVTRPNGVVAFLDPHASMSIANARVYSERHSLSRRDTRKMVAWATSARFNRRFEESELRRALADAGLEQVHLERRLDGMVWFTRARTPSAAPLAQTPVEALETQLA